MGDFNTVLHPKDRQFGAPVQEVEIRDFRDFLFDTGMTEVQYMGRNYTWTNNHVYSKIDRAIVNGEWMTTMPTLQVQVMEPYFSDHSPLSIQFGRRRGNRGKPFIFLNYLADDERGQARAKTLNTQHYMGVDKKLKYLRDQLKEVQEKMDTNLRQHELIEEERKLKNQIEKWDHIEESIYRQKSRVKWLQLGDSNSAYFFANIKVKNSQNYIRELNSLKGHLLQREKDIEVEIIDYYKSLLGTAAKTVPAIQLQVMKQGPTLRKSQ
uniref:Craniofacial development protein 2-like n=2 Tax=Nicotiana TaxID=4085 RepID=A0A1S3ZTX6_TOBAC|nr:PREDICTED: uncharacterized protein LOC104232310 [Nicotiana sylvestris]XP_016467865.1 PREDICTED: uncharacterized protein LOC107790453 [Nicotiana tabacum]